MEPLDGPWTWCTARHPRGCQCTLASPPTLCLPRSIPAGWHPFSGGIAHARVTLSSQLSYPNSWSSPTPVAARKSARRAIGQEQILKNKPCSFEGQSCVTQTKHERLVLDERSKHLMFFLHVRRISQRKPVQNPVLQAKVFIDKKQKVFL